MADGSTPSTSMSSGSPRSSTGTATAPFFVEASLRLTMASTEAGFKASIIASGPRMRAATERGRSARGTTPSASTRSGESTRTFNLGWTRRVTRMLWVSKLVFAGAATS